MLAYPVRWINVTLSVGINFQPPHIPVPFCIIIVAHLAVYVSAITMNHFTKEALPGHIAG
jgi:hypothetical protein